jgi:hypothetical protein
MLNVESWESSQFGGLVIWWFGDLVIWLWVFLINKNDSASELKVES